MSSQNSKPSLLRRILRGIGTLIVTAGFVAAAGAAFVFALDMLNERATAAEPPETAEIVPVAVRPLYLDDSYQVERRFIGQTESRQAVDLSFELSGRLIEILVDEGDAVEAGTEIARLDTDLLIADRDRLVATRAALSAQLAFAETQVTRNTRLSTEGFASQQRLDQSIANRDELMARIAETDAALTGVEIRIRKSRLRAPFSGRVAQRVVDGGETLNPGQPVLRLLDDSTTQVRVGLPLDTDLAKLEQAQVEIGGQRYTAQLDTVRPDIDPVTRTRTAILTLQGADDLGLGRTATVILKDDIDVAGSWVPLDAVKEGRGSVWSVLVVDDANTVRSAAVEILHAESDRLYVRGSFRDGAQMIETGPQRVTPGQTVRVLEGG